MDDYRAHDGVSADDDDDSRSAVAHESIAVHAGLDAPRDADAPSCESLSAHAAHSGWLWKRGYTFGCVPRWKHRFCVLAGGFIFKYDNLDGQRPKGLPIPVLGATCTIGPVDPARSAAPHAHTMVLETLRKSYVLGASSREELDAWIAAVAKARERTIKQQLGHADLTPADDFANRSGQLLTQRRIQREAEDLERRPSAVAAY